MEMELGIELECVGDDVLGDDTVFKMIKNAGFGHIFSDKLNIRDVETVMERSAKVGLTVDFLHAPFRGVNDFWLEGDNYLPLNEKIVETIDSAGACGIPIVIVHPDSGWNPPNMCDLGIKRFDALVERAEKKGVKIAFENLRNFGTLSAMMQRYRGRDSVGFCYDCGHEHCYTKTVHFTDLFGERILCTHIHDNFGKDGRDDPDDHLMMFDGNIDYADMMARLREVGYNGVLTVELAKDEHYAHMSDEEYINAAYERILKISKM